jgi:hypothetical protein
MWRRFRGSLYPPTTNCRHLGYGSDCGHSVNRNSQYRPLSLENLNVFARSALLSRRDACHEQLWAIIGGQLAKLDLLILDDFSIAPIAAYEGNDLLELFDDRVGAWHAWINGPTLADAIADSVVLCCEAFPDCISFKKLSM